MRPPETADALRAFVLARIQRRARLPEGADLGCFDYIEAGYVDSLGLLAFIADLEDHAGVDIGEADVLSPAFRTVDGLTRLLLAKRA